jgi:hypothetical protein
VRQLDATVRLLRPQALSTLAPPTISIGEYGELLERAGRTVMPRELVEGYADALLDGRLGEIVAALRAESTPDSSEEK